MRSSPPLNSTADSAWRSALLQVKGEFRANSTQRVIERVGVPILAIASLLLLMVVIKAHPAKPWTAHDELQLGKAAVLVVGACILLRRLGFRYVFEQGSVRAYTAWGLMWSEDLTTITGARYMRERSTPTLEISWADRKRRLVLLDSLRHELEALVETANPPSIEFSVEEASSDSGPSWICPGCHEENPGSFEECWKCQRDRPSAAE